MIRIVVKNQYLGPEGQSMGSDYKTFDVSLPEVEKYLTDKPDSPYASNWVSGIEIIKETLKS